ncbi:hypothetical protein NX059_009477 [Plenodomus lindquistii]|nr:hypothetical protein NX059_009477 [Plenodomus lindquistii]
MHRKNPISVLVYNSLFPTPSPTDPPSFSAHLSKNLVGEVRIETANFYGSLDTIEARYPGLNYAFAPHRKRLGRFPHHRRLFEAFDRLGLTEAEIQGFCRWEGTLWARERYERDEGVRVEDTTGVEIQEWIDRRGQRDCNGSSNGINVKTDIEVEIEQVQHQQHHQSNNNNNNNNNNNTTDRGTSSSRFQHQHQHQHQHPQHHHQHQQQPQSILDTEMPDSPSPSPSDQDSDSEPSLHTSIGFSLNARLLHAAALREQGANVSMDPEWEQYLKEAQERGELNIDATREALRSMAGQIAQLHQAQRVVGSSAGAGTEGGGFGAAAQA